MLFPSKLIAEGEFCSKISSLFHSKLFMAALTQSIEKQDISYQFCLSKSNDAIISFINNIVIARESHDIVDSEKEAEILKIHYHRPPYQYLVEMLQPLKHQFCEANALI